MYRQSYLSLSRGRVEYRPRTWASPASPGLTRSRRPNPGVDRSNSAWSPGLSGRGPTMLISPRSMLTTCGASSIL